VWRILGGLGWSCQRPELRARERDDEAALRLDRDIKWDPEAERIVGDDEAQSFTRREPRKGYEIGV
jgi:hypothetical protein